MENNSLKVMLEQAREIKGYSQRDLAKKIGLSNTSLNDLENGRVKKVDIDMLRKIAEELDLSLRDLLEAAGYNDLAIEFDKGKTKSTKDYSRQIQDYRAFYYDILDWDAKKRKQSAEISKFLDSILLEIEKNKRKLGKYDWEDVESDIKKAIEMLKPIHEKFDYSKLPKDMSD